MVRVAVANRRVLKANAGKGRQRAREFVMIRAGNCVAIFGLMFLTNCFASFALGGIACTDSAFGVGPFAPSGYYLSSVTTNSGCELGSTLKDEPRPAAV